MRLDGATTPTPNSLTEFANLVGTAHHLNARTSRAPASLNATERTIDVVAVTSADVRQWSWFNGTYYLSLQMEGAEMGRLTAPAPRAPVLYRHDAGEKIGVIEHAWQEGTELRATLRFEPPGISAEADKQWESILNGGSPALSIGFNILAATEAADYDESKRVLVTAWEPYEVSVCSVGACAEARILHQPTTPLPGQQPIPDFDKLAREALRRQRALESQRLTLINELVRDYQLSEADRQEFVAGDLDEAGLYRAAHQKLTRRSRELAAATGAYSLTVARDSTAQVRLAAEEWLDGRMTGRRHDAKWLESSPARRFAHHGSMLDVCRACLEATGSSTLGLSPDEIFEGAISSSDFPKVVENVINKRLAPLYENTPRTFLPWVRVDPEGANDFKPIDVRFLDGRLRYHKVAENNDDPPRSTFNEEQGSYVVEEYIAAIDVTYRMMRDDDLNAIMRNIEQIAPAAADHQSDTVWRELMSNPMMFDGEKLFSAAHNNQATTAAAPSISAFSDARLAFRKQKDRAGNRIGGLAPSLLIVPPELYDSARQIITDTTPARQTAATGDQGRNIYANEYTIIEENRLSDPDITGNSETAWYLTTAPGRVYTAEISFMDNVQVPRLRLSRGFYNEGFKFASTLRYGFAILEWRSFFRNAGA